MAIYSSHRLTLGKEEIDIFSSVSMGIFDLFTEMFIESRSRSLEGHHLNKL